MNRSSNWLVLLILSIWCVTLPSAAAQQKRIYIANDDHTDYMWTGNEANYQTWFIETLQYYMNQIDSTATEPNLDARSKYNVDGSFWMWVYEHPMPAPALQPSRTIDTLMNSYVRTGKITMPLNTLILLYGAMPAEAVLRSMYYAGQLERRYSTRFSLVVPQENQTMPGGVAALWAGSGAEFGWKGICNCASRINAATRPREIYYQRGPDGSNILLKWNGRHNDGTQNPDYSLGGYLEAAYDSRITPHPGLQAQYLFNNTGAGSSWWPWTISAAFGAGGDSDKTLTTAFVDAARANTLNARVIVSNEVDFFQDFKSTYGAVTSGTLQIPTYSGSFGNEWDLYVASMGELAANFKRNIEKLRSAEALAAIASLNNPSFMNSRTAARDKAFIDAGLFYEHDWTADSGIVSRDARAQWQRRIHDEFAGYVSQLQSDALSVVGSQIASPASVTRFAVFNPLSWSRSDFADLSFTPSGAFHVVDLATGSEVPSQLITSGSSTFIRILAANLPSVGYRVYEVRSGSGTTFPASASVNGATIDNGIYGVTLAVDGSISSIVNHRDADRHLEMLGQKIHSLGSGNGSVTVESSGPVSTTLLVNAGGNPAHQTRVTLYTGVERVDIEGLITQNFGGASTYTVAYDSKFNLTNPIIRHEEVGSIARVGRLNSAHPQDQNPGDYANENSRTDYLTFNHFVDLSEATRGITVSNWDSQFYKAGNSSFTTLDETTAQIKAVVGMQPDGTALGIMNQGGDSRFLNRYAIYAHGAYDQAAAMRFSMQHQNPLVSVRVTGSVSSPLPAANWSLLSINSPDILLWALKPPEDGIGSGIVARVWNLAESTRALQLSLPPYGITQAKRTTHIETELGAATLSAGALTDQLARQQMRTYKLLPGTAGPIDITAPSQPQNLALH
ncbi:MAG: glycoside hydrolase [Oligoflexia bacterium]|nr:glycoside hydrolase [Oligoflexia bacterium]